MTAQFGAVEDLRLDPLICPESSASIGGSGEFPPSAHDCYRPVTESSCTLHLEATEEENKAPIRIRICSYIYAKVGLDQALRFYKS